MSFNIANSGLSAITEQLTSISNNIANSGTVGYKSARAEFASLYAQAQPLGVTVSGVTQSITRGGNINSTGNVMDLAINGNGFFVVNDASGTTSYTRAGYFGLDNTGFLSNNQGMRLQGYPVDANGNLLVGTISDMSVGAGSMPAKATDQLAFVANLNANSDIPAVTPFDPTNRNSFNDSYTTKLYDSLGREHTLTQYFIKIADNAWQAEYRIDGTSAGGSQPMTFNTQGVMTAPVATVNVGIPVTGADPLSIDINYTGTTQFGSDFAALKNGANGFASAERTGVQIDRDGSVYSTFSNGERLIQGQLVLANFTNPQGLQAKDGTSWAQTTASGTPVLGVPGVGLLGGIQSGALEGSNVDLTAELVNLMTAQRNYQANTKVISTNDNMMQALFQAI